MSLNPNTGRNLFVTLAVCFGLFAVMLPWFDPFERRYIALVLLAILVARGGLTLFVLLLNRIGREIADRFWKKSDSTGEVAGREPKPTE